MGLSFLDMLWVYFLVFVFAALPFFEAYGVVPVVILAGLSFVPSLLIGIIGNIVTVLFLLVFLDQFNQWRAKRRERKGKVARSNKRSLRAQRLWDKYGMPGLSMIGPMVVGSHLTALMCAAFGGKRQAVFYWMSASITLWSTVFAVLALLGVNTFNSNNEMWMDQFID